MTTIISIGAVRTSIMLGAALTAGCIRYSVTDTARTTFARDHSCPEHRVKVTAVDGPPPPAEIRGDAERVALWRKRDDESYVRAEGCRRDMTYACSEAAYRTADGGGRVFMSCTPSMAAMQGEVIRRAAVELNCPASSLRVVRADVWLELEGCGTHAIYQYDRTRQDWVRNSFPSLMVPVATPVGPSTTSPPAAPPGPVAPAPSKAPAPTDPS